MTEMFGEAWSPMSVRDLAPDDDDDDSRNMSKSSSFKRLFYLSLKKIAGAITAYQTP